MRVLLVSRYCRYPSWQGSAQHARLFARMLREAGHEVRLLTGEDVAAAEATRQDGYAVHSVPMERRGGKVEAFQYVAHRNAHVQRAARRLMDELDPDVVHVGALAQMGPALEEAYRRGIPVVAMVHSFEWLCLTRFMIDAGGRPCSGPESTAKCAACIAAQCSPRRRWAIRAYRILERFGMGSRLVDAWSGNRGRRLDVAAVAEDSYRYLQRLRDRVSVFLAQSPMSGATLEAHGVPPQRVVFLEQCLPEAKQASYEREGESLQARPLRLGYAGRVDPEKGLDVLGDAIRALPEAPLEIWVLSSGATQASVLAAMGGALPERARLVLPPGLDETETYCRQLARLDLLVVPSTCRETGPRTLLEAHVQRVPVLASDSVGNRYTIEDRVSGRILPAGDAGALRDAIAQVLESPQLLEQWRRRIRPPITPARWFDRCLAIHREAIRSARERKPEAGVPADSRGAKR